MKKLFFSALAVMAVVTSAVAYTANPLDILYFDDPSIAGLQCTIPVTNRSELPVGPSLGVQTYDVVSNPAGCPKTQEVFESE